MRTIATAAMETLLNLPHLDIFVKGEVRKGAYWLKCCGDWRHHYLHGHSRITKMITDPVLEMGNDHMIFKYSFEKLFDIQIGWKVWSQKEMHCQPNSFIWYTDSSKIDSGAGAGFHRKNLGCEMPVSLVQYITVFQVEIHAIEVCVWERLLYWMGPDSIQQSGCRKGISTLLNHSQLVWDCLQNLIPLAKRNKVILVWLPCHGGVHVVGNERADALPRKGSANVFTGLEPVLGITEATDHGPVFEWVRRQHPERLTHVEGHRHSKLIMDKLSLPLTADIL
jgi:hypothetical protein